MVYKYHLQVERHAFVHHHIAIHWTVNHWPRYDNNHWCCCDNHEPAAKQAIHNNEHWFNEHRVNKRCVDERGHKYIYRFFDYIVGSFDNGAKFDPSDGMTCLTLVGICGSIILLLRGFWIFFTRYIVCRDFSIW